MVVETTGESSLATLGTGAVKRRVGRSGDVTAFSANVAAARWLLTHGVEVVSGEAVGAADNRDWHWDLIVREV